MQSLSLFSLLRQARCMIVVPSLPHGVPTGCKGRCYELRDGHYVLICVTPSFPSRGSRKRPRAAGDGRSARSALQRG